MTTKSSRRASASVARQTPMRLTWVLAHEPVSVFEAAARRFAEILRGESDGRLEVDVISATQHNGGRRMTPAEVIQEVASGRIQMCQTYTTAFGERHEPLRALDLPFLFESHEHAARALDGAVGQRLMDGLRPQGLRGLGFTYSGGYRVLSSASRQIRCPEDLAGLRVRTAPSPVAQAVFETWGAVAVPAPLHETPALARAGRIDAAETTYPRYWDQGQSEAHRVVSETRHSLLLTMMVLNEDFYQGLSAREREAVRHAAAEAARLERATSIEQGEDVKRRCPERGIAVVDVAEAQRERFRALARPVYERFIPVVGAGLVKELQDA